MKQVKRYSRFGKTVLAGCLAGLCGIGSTGWCSKIVYPWRSTTAIVKTNETFEVWFSADSGQVLQSVQLKSPYKTVTAGVVTNSTSSWVYDEISGNTCNRKYTVTVPASTPADRYDLVLVTSTGNLTSAKAVKVIKSPKNDYYLMHVTDSHMYQGTLAYKNIMPERRDLIMKIADIMDVEILFDTGDELYAGTVNPTMDERMNVFLDGSGSLIGPNDLSAAFFIVPGDHAGPSHEFESDTEQENSAHWNQYYGLENYGFKYGNGRFYGFNIIWGSQTTRSSEAISWFNGAGSGGNFRLTAAHRYGNTHKTINDSKTLNLVLAGCKHHVRTYNPFELDGEAADENGDYYPDSGQPEICYIGGALGYHLEFNLFRINNSNGTFTKPSGSTAVASAISSGTEGTPSTWVSRLERNIPAANNGTLTTNSAKFINRYNFTIYGAKARFVMQRGTYVVNTGSIVQQFDGTLSGTNVTVVDVAMDLQPSSTNTVNISGSTPTVPVVSFAVPAGNMTVTEGTNLYVKVNATDPDVIQQVRLYKNGVRLVRTEGGAPYEWCAAGQNDPELQNLQPGTFTLRAEAVDNVGTTGTTSTITITVQAANLPPYFTSDPFSKPNATVGVAYNEPFSGKAVDPEGGAMTFSKVAGPEWLSVTAGGNATGMPTSVDIGTNTFMVKVTDAGGLYDTATMTIAVTGAAPQTVTFTSIAAEDGYVNESSETSNIGGSLNSTNSAGSGLRIGDMSDKKQVKTFVSFDTSSIPDGAVIQSATLKLMRGGLTGTVTNLGLIKVDIKGGTGFSGSTAVQNGDFEAVADATNVATMSYPSANGTLSTGSLNATGLTKVNKTGKTQLKVYFATDDDNDATSDYLGFYPAENATAGNRPVLEVTYQ